MEKEAGKKKPTTGFVAEITAYFHLCGYGDNGNTDFVLDACIQRVVNVAWVASGQRSEHYEDFP